MNRAPPTAARHAPPRPGSRSISALIPSGSLLLVMSLWAGGCVTAGGQGVGRRAVDFSLQGLDGQQVTLGASLARREVVLLSFWATWCRPCLSELPYLQGLWEEHRQEGFTVLAVSMDGPETESQVRPTVARYGFRFPVLLDRDTRVAGLYNPRRAAPLSILVGRDGHVVWSHEGFVTADRDTIRTQIERALAAPR